MERHIRKKLGQTEFGIMNYYDFEKYIGKDKCDRKRKKECDCVICSYYKLYYNWKKTNHIKLNFDARNDIEERCKNKRIIELFNEEIGNKRAIIHTHKGTVWCYIVKKEEYEKNKQKYWMEHNTYGEMELPYEKKMEFSAMGTVEIIGEIIEYCM